MPRNPWAEGISNLGTAIIGNPRQEAAAQMQARQAAANVAMTNAEADLARDTLAARQGLSDVIAQFAPQQVTTTSFQQPQQQDPMGPVAPQIPGAAISQQEMRLPTSRDLLQAYPELASNMLRGYGGDNPEQAANALGGLAQSIFGVYGDGNLQQRGQVAAGTIAPDQVAERDARLDMQYSRPSETEVKGQLLQSMLPELSVPETKQLLGARIDPQGSGISAREQKIRQYMEVYGVTRAQAIAMIDNMAGHDRDPYTGNTYFFDETEMFGGGGVFGGGAQPQGGGMAGAMGAPQGTGGSVTASLPSDTQAPPAETENAESENPDPYQEMEGRKLGDVIDVAVGPLGAGRNLISRTLGWAFDDLNWADTTQGRTLLGGFNAHMRKALTISDRPSDWQQQQINQLLPSTGFFESPTRAADNLASLEVMINDELEFINKNLSRRDISTKERKNLQITGTELRGALNKLGDLKRVSSEETLSRAISEASSARDTILGDERVQGGQGGVAGAMQSKPQGGSEPSIEEIRENAEATDEVNGRTLYYYDGSWWAE